MALAHTGFIPDLILWSFLAVFFWHIGKSIKREGLWGPPTYWDE